MNFCYNFVYQFLDPIPRVFFNLHIMISCQFFVIQTPRIMSSRIAA